MRRRKVEKLNKLLVECRQAGLEDVDLKIKAMVDSLGTEELQY